MPLLNKLLSSRTNCKRSKDGGFAPLNIEIGANERSSASFGKDQVRILLFRECEWRGRKLLFDSIAVEKFRAKSRCQHLAEEKQAEILQDGFVYEYEKVARDDVSLLSEMVFGTVAMTYRGPSFKVHAIDSPPCIMCTKVFPAPEHISCRLSERHSDETLGQSTNVDTNSSNGSMLTLVSHPNLVSPCGNRLSPDLRKNSTCSSTGSGWDIDLPPPPGSSQSLESSGSSGVGSLTSLRRRWLRAVSTSLSCSESEEFLHENHSHDNHNRRHKTRLGLAMLVRLTRGHERRMEARLLEHVALLEGILDRLCCSCFEQSRKGKQGERNGNGLAARMHRASTRCALWLLRLFTDARGLRTPLIWHQVLLNPSPIPNPNPTASVLYRSLNQMCRLLDDIDTKSTNFFLSTVLTAVLTHHLGWVHTVLSNHDRRLVETLAKRYPCNPLWAQLGDLYGAVGNPLRLAHTVIAGETGKTDLINAVLTFVSYFIRSGNVERRQEQRCSPQQELDEAILLLGRFEKKRSSSSSTSTSQRYGRSFCSYNQNDQEDSVFVRETNSPVAHRKTSKRRVDLVNGDPDAEENLRDTSRGRNYFAKAKSSKLKRSDTVQKNLDAFAINLIKSELSSCMKNESFDDESSDKLFAMNDAVQRKHRNTSIDVAYVSETIPLGFGESKEYPQRAVPLSDIERKLDALDPSEFYMDSKLASFQGYSENEFESHKLRPDGADGDPLVLAATPTNGCKEREVLFMLGGDEKTAKSTSLNQLRCNCQCSFAFTRAPSTSAQLPEGVLRKIIQRNFPESSKSIQSSTSSEKPTRFCPNCMGGSSYAYEGNKLLLETPTNATEVLRTCGGSVGTQGNRATRINRSNSLEYLMDANSVVELPMPRSQKVGPKDKKEAKEKMGFAETLLHGGLILKSGAGEDVQDANAEYACGLVVQGLVKTRRKKIRRRNDDIDDGETEDASEDEWWRDVREDVGAAARFPVVDQPVAEALCVLADLDAWQVGILSSNAPSHQPPLPVGMSRLVANMLEAFAYLWRKYHSPVQCVRILEGKLREMWLQSEALAEMLMNADLCEASIATLTEALDLDVADVPLLLAVAATHSPLVAQRFGLTLS